MVFTGISMIDFHPEQVIKAIQKGLPGAASQKLMAPSVRFTGQKLPNPELSKQSSILILLFPQEANWTTVLIERTPFGPHGGQISFPGGKKDDADKSEYDTALREAQEELGVPREDVELIGQLTRLYVPNSNFWISPFIGRLDYEPDWIPDPKEVQSVITVPLKDLFLPANKQIANIERRQIQIRAPFYDVQGHQVWGATAMIISELEALLS